ncbi:hypothetical protein TELCIR_21402, partial [Teladorsagia circumcincta]
MERHESTGFEIKDCRNDAVGEGWGCYLQNSGEYLMAGESRIVNRQRHECEVLGDGRVRYQVKVIGCVRDGQQYNIAQVFTDRHVRYQCKNDGSLDVL